MLGLGLWGARALWLAGGTVVGSVALKTAGEGINEAGEGVQKGYTGTILLIGAIIGAIYLFKHKVI